MSELEHLSRTPGEATVALTDQIATPWGMSDRVEVSAPGIWWVETPSHGGFLVTRERLEVIRTKFPTRQCQVPYTGDSQWFEEDAAYAYVILTFPDFFSPDALAGARWTLEHFQPAELAMGDSLTVLH